MRTILLSIASLLMLAACSARQQLITGEPLVFGLDPRSGAVVDRDLLGRDDAAGAMVSAIPATIPHKGEIIALVVNNVFLRYVQALVSPHVLVYAEVFDDGQDDPATAITKVLFNEQDQPPGVNLGLADRLLYGPTPYKGFPIRIKFNIIELDKDNKRTASRLLNAAGKVGAVLQPQAAPAVGVVVQVAELINELNKDDFDLTLYPVEKSGTADVGDELLTKPQQGKPEPIQRHGKPFATVSTLRTGSYVAIKRELPERVRQREGSLPSYLMYDWTQEALLYEYVNSGDGKRLLVEEVLRLQGGYLYRIVRRITGPDGRELGRAVVRNREGPNRAVEFGLTPGIRQRFIDQTYVVFTVLNGLPMGLNEESLRASSRRDVEQLRRLLDSPSQLLLSESIGPKVDELAGAITVALEGRRLAEAASRRVGREPQFRTSVKYPHFWTSRVESLAGLTAESAVYRNAVAKNAAALATLSDLIVNLSPLRPENEKEMTALRRLEQTAFEAVPGQPGLFKLSAAGLQALNAARN